MGLLIHCGLETGGLVDVLCLAGLVLDRQGDDLRALGHV